MMKATAIFHNDSTGCELSLPNTLGGTTYSLFDSVSAMLNYADENDIKITEIKTL